MKYDKLEKWIQVLGKFISYDIKKKDPLNIDKEDIIFQDKEAVKHFVEQIFTLDRITVTAAIIVKDEERVIKRCPDSILNQFDEIVIVDTGSKDKTVEIIESVKDNKIRLYRTKWNENFAEARNFALDKVNTEWVFFIDADEILLDMDCSIIVDKHVLVDKERGIIPSNIKNDEYAFCIFLLYVQFHIYHRKYGNLDSVFECLEIINKDNNDVIYLKTYAEICFLKNEWENLLRKMILYRKEHFDIQYGTMHTEGIQRFKLPIEHYFNIIDKCRKM